MKVDIFELWLTLKLSHWLFEILCGRKLLHLKGGRNRTVPMLAELLITGS